MMTQSYSADSQAHSSGILVVGFPQKEAQNTEEIKG